MEGIGEQQALFTQQDVKIHGGIYIGNTGEELRERFSKHRYDAKTRPDSNELAAHINKHQHEI